MFPERLYLSEMSESEKHATKQINVADWNFIEESSSKYV